MLSYQHAFHAANLADIHKHALLAQALAYLTRKEKPLTYIETHAGRGLYDLADAAAQKTGEAAFSRRLTADWFPPDHPFMAAQKAAQKAHGAQAYAGSPWIARHLLRPTDRLHLAELHPQENTALRAALTGPNLRIYKQDGLALAQSLSPPAPRRGLMLIDPSWEIRGDYQDIPRHMDRIARKWNVGILMLWYPLLDGTPHAPMLQSLEKAHPGALRHEVRFPPARPGHRMTGSGLFVVNPPWGLTEAAADLAGKFAAL